MDEIKEESKAKDFGLAYLKYIIETIFVVTERIPTI
jgi:hypothetical protein